MLNSIFSAILKVILYIAGFISSVIVSPIFALVELIFPDFTPFMADFNTYVSDYVLRGIAFAREVFLNVTGFPRPLFHLIVTLYLAKLTFHLASIPIKFIINIYRALRGSGGEMVE